MCPGRFYGSCKARDVYRKALAASDDPELRTACIVPLAILAESIDERIEVLESGDATVPRIAIDLAEARATMALNNGDRAAALDAWPCSESRGVVSASEARLVWRELCAAHPAIAEWAGDAMRMLPAREMILLAAMCFEEARGDAAVRAAFSSMLGHPC